ncbi:unnamed protein product [Effrenium voratum]|uniref:Dihydropteridine reductase n=1 Tax=Effrenium voratum TaxID=2562239 RepID=A0AA36IDA9_9DINO|nr:unnamed protein product [Effrenium voratum]CAJ1421704.1 unnamed protein product [Effrenium voratum]
MARRVLVMGAAGQLGRQVCGRFASSSWRLIAADVVAAGGADLALGGLGAAAALEALQEKLRGERLDAVVNVAGGFAMGSAQDAEVLDNTKAMVESSVYSSVLAAHLAAKALKEEGLVILPGAAAAWGPTAWSLPYGLSKVAVHHLVRSLAAEGSTLPKGAKTIGLAPQILDTPQNRAAMPDADRSTWASLEEVAEQIERWCADPQLVQSGQVYLIDKAPGQPAGFEAKDPL